MSAETKVCPFCAEEILVAAIKCKHCGEMLGDAVGQRCTSCGRSFLSATELAQHVQETHRLSSRCSRCAATFPTKRAVYLHEVNVHGLTSSSSGAQRPRAESAARSGAAKGKRISEVGIKGDGGLACPNCGGTQFKSKRSRGAKLLAVPTVGVGALALPKRRVKCETCGTEYRRG